jgi:ribosome-binding factor A
MAEQRRIDRLEKQVQEELGSIIESEVEDPRARGVTVTGVRLSSDLRHARVFIGGLGDEIERTQALAGLNSARNFLRRQLSHLLPHLKRTPELTFDYDESIENGSRVEELLEQISIRTGHDSESS